MRNSRRVFIVCAFLVPMVSIASDLGVIGHTYPIIEMDFLEFLQIRLKEMQDNPGPIIY